MDIQALARERSALLQWLRHATGQKDPRSATRLVAVLGEGAPASAEQVLQELPALQQLMVDGSRLLSLAAVCYCRALTHLSVAACQLGDLEGLGACTGLQQLHAPHNDIADLAPLAGLAALEVLDLSHNAVSDPDMLPYLADCPALAALDLSANPARFTQQQVLAALPQVSLYGGSCAIEHSASGPRLSSDMPQGTLQQQQLAGGSGVGLYWRKMRVEALAGQDLEAEQAAATTRAAAAAAPAGAQGGAGGAAASAVSMQPVLGDGGEGPGEEAASSSQLTHGAGALLLGGAAARGLRRRQQQQQQQQQQAQGATGFNEAGVRGGADEDEEAGQGCELLPGAVGASAAGALMGRQQASSSSYADPSGSRSGLLTLGSSSLEGIAGEAGSMAGLLVNPLLKGGQAGAPSSAAAPSSRPTTASSVWLTGRPSTSSSVSSVLAPGGSSLFGLGPRGAPSEASRPPSQQAALLASPDLLGCGPAEAALLGEGGSSRGSSRPSTAGGWELGPPAPSHPSSGQPWRGSSRGSQGGELGGEDSSGGAGVPLSRSSSTTSAAVSRLGSARPQPPGGLGLLGGRSGELEQPPVGTWALKAAAAGQAGGTGTSSGGSGSSSSSSQGRLQLPRIASARAREAGR